MPKDESKAASENIYQVAEAARSVKIAKANPKNAEGMINSKGEWVKYNRD